MCRLPRLGERRELRAAPAERGRDLWIGRRLRQPGIGARLFEAPLPEGAPCLVVEDSAHLYETTAAALRSFARFVQLGSFFVVEDTCLDVDALRLSDDWPRGVLAAMRDWFETPAAAGFTVQRDLEIYGVTCHPYGFLQRVVPSPQP